MTNTIEGIPRYADEIDMQTKPRDFLLSGENIASIFDEGVGNADVTESSQAIAEFAAQGIEVISTGIKDSLADAFRKNEMEG